MPQPGDYEHFYSDTGAFIRGRSPYKLDPHRGLPDAAFIAFQIAAWVVVPLTTALALGAVIAHVLMPTIR
jgi:hypothetical protein